MTGPFTIGGEGARHLRQKGTAMGFVGLDVAAVTILAKQLETQSQEIDTMARELTAALANTEWIGADQRNFLEQWQSTHRPNLIRGRELLAGLARLARANATEQQLKSKG